MKSLPISSARVAGDGLGGLVHVGDLAVGADGDQRVEAGLKQAAAVARWPASTPPRVLPLGDFVIDLEGGPRLAPLVAVDDPPAGDDDLGPIAANMDQLAFPRSRR